MTATERTLRYRVIGMDCADDARDIETTARGVETVRDVRVSVASHVMTLHLVDPATGASDVEEAVAGLGYCLHPITDDPKDTEAGNMQTHMTPAYRRALWIVVLLNLGYGAVEMVGGFLSDSQALKTDALDFLGDGLITFLSIVAVRWGLAWRARSALIQGIFLVAMGVGVLVNTVARLGSGYEPGQTSWGFWGSSPWPSTSSPSSCSFRTGREMPTSEWCGFSPGTMRSAISPW